MKKFCGRNWKQRIWIGMLVLAVSGFAGCGGSSDKTSVAEQSTGSYNSESYITNDIYEPRYEETAEAPAEAAEEAGETGAGTAVASNRKLIKTVNMDVETEVFDELVPKVEGKVSELGGYIESLNVYNGSIRYDGGHRSASLTVRIPKDRLENFVTAVSKISNVTSRSENVQDITLQYVDVESHKAALKVEQERLLALLEQAENMEDIIAIEQRLSEVRYQLQTMESQLRTYDNLVDYSTVYLNISEVEVLTPPLQLSAWEKMSVGFLNSCYNIGKGIKNFFIYLVIFFPYIILWTAIILLIILFVKLIIKIQNKKAVNNPARSRNMRMSNAGGPPSAGNYYGMNNRPNAGAYSGPDSRPGAGSNTGTDSQSGTESNTGAGGSPAGNNEGPTDQAGNKEL